MGLRLFRWLLGFFLWLLWPGRHRKRRREADEDSPRRTRARSHRTSHRRGEENVVRIEVDNEIGRFYEGPAFSFWSSSRIILILSLLLWWIQPAGPMIAGFVGGRRAGSPWKAVIAAIVPVAVILIANFAYTHSFATQQIDFVASLPLVIGDGVSSILPFLGPYRDFMITYLRGFVEALQATFGMGTNGYLMVIIFAYIGGLIGEQARRELSWRTGGERSHSVGLTLPWPFVHSRPREADDDADDEVDEEVRPHRHRRPTYAHGSPVPAAARHRRGRHRSPDRFEDLRAVDADLEGSPAGRRGSRSRRHVEEDEEPDDEPPARRRPAKTHAGREEDDRGNEPPRREPRAVQARSRDEELAIQRFVERALRNYDKTKL
jgi:hypothetical protein